MERYKHPRPHFSWSDSSQIYNSAPSQLLNCHLRCSFFYSLKSQQRKRHKCSFDKYLVTMISFFYFTSNLFSLSVSIRNLRIQFVFCAITTQYSPKRSKVELVWCDASELGFIKKLYVFFIFSISCPPCRHDFL